MIDWSLVGEKRIVVRVPTEEAVNEFFDELLQRYPFMNIPPEYVESNLRKYGDDAAIYLAPHWDSRGLHWEYSGYEWYAINSPYCDSVFIEWGTAPTDLGDLACEHEIDVCSLFSSEEVLI